MKRRVWSVLAALLAVAGAGIVATGVQRVDLAGERVGSAPATFEPIVGTWVVAQDGPDKVVMVDGRPWVASKDNPTRLLVQSARRLYGTSNEELMDNAKQFAYYPVALLRSVQDFSKGSISVKFKTVAGDADRASGILFNVKPNGDWLAIRYNDTENNVALWEFHGGIRRPIKFSDRAKPFMLATAEVIQQTVEVCVARFQKEFIQRIRFMRKGRLELVDVLVEISGHRKAAAIRKMKVIDRVHLHPARPRSELFEHRAGDRHRIAEQRVKVRRRVEGKGAAMECAAVAANHVVLLDQQHRQAVTRQQAGANQAANTRTDHDDVVGGLRVGLQRPKRPHGAGGRFRP